MKKTQKTALTAAMFAAAMNMSSCGAADTELVSGTDYKAGADSDTVVAAEYDPEIEEQQDVYGPPSYFEDPTQPTTVTYPVYGPPYYETTTETTTQEPTVPPVYGPPLYFKGDVNGDFIINSLDTVAMRKGLINGFDTGRFTGKYTVDGYLTADLNEDGIVSVSDLVQLQKFILGEIKDFDNHFGEYQGAYGPPPDYKEEEPEPTTAEPEYDPEDEFGPPVYGPPDWFGLE